MPLTKEELEIASQKTYRRAHARFKRQPQDPNRVDDAVRECVDFGRNPDGDARIFRLRQEVNPKLPCYQGPLYGLKDFEGFVYAPQALAPCLQKQLARLAITDYCELPHMTNVDANNATNKSSIIKDSSKNEDGCDRYWENYRRQQRQPAKGSAKGEATRKVKSFRKLSWATLGYHYDWTARSYHRDRRSPMPSLLQSLGAHFAPLCSPTNVENDCKSHPSSFTASAAIVNYYTAKSTMGGHRDDLEEALEQPVVSLSVGHRSAIFLIQRQKQQPPSSGDDDSTNGNDDTVVPILVRPGDVMVMGGASRLCRHGMARILPLNFGGEYSPVTAEDKDDDLAKASHAVTIKAMSFSDDTGNVDDEQLMDTFLLDYRININLRQVYSDDVPSFP